MNVIVCYKTVPEEQDIVIKPDHTLDTDKAELRLGAYDLNAVEEGARLIEKYGGTLTALSVGGNELKNRMTQRAVLSRGPEDLIIVSDPELARADAHQTAQALAAAIKKRGDFDLIICGEGSSDLYAQQVGAQLGELLSVANITAVNKIEVVNKTLLLERDLDTEIEVVEAALPAVLSVTPEINCPEIPGMKSVLEAGKKSVINWDLSDLDIQPSASIEVISTLAPQGMQRKNIIIEGDSENDILEFVKHIKTELNR